MTLTSYNGWTASKDQAEIGIKSYAIPGTQLKIRCAEAVAPLIVGFCKEFNELIEPLDGGQLDDWGYAFRMVRGSTDRLSNHSSGTAIDLNAVKHPLGKENTFTVEQRKVLDILCKKYGLRAGYTYKTRKDDMHFEIVETPEQVKARVIKMKLK